MSHDAASEDSQESSSSESIQLDQFLKIQGLAESGGHAKILVQSGQVEVNGHVETRRKRQLFQGDEVTFEGETFAVVFD